MTARAIWLVDHAPIMGGAELFALKLARDADVDVVVVCPPESELARCCRAEGIELREVAMAHFASRRAVLVPATIARLARVLRGAPAGAVLVASSAWAQALVVAAAPLLRGHRIVHLLHEQDTAARPTARAALKRVGVPVAIGGNGARTYAAALGRDVAHVNNVLGDADLAAAARAPRRRAGSSPRPGPPAVGALGRLIPEKGLVELVDELAACPDGWRTATLAGPPQDPAYAARLAQRIVERGLDGRIVVRGRTESATFLDELDALIVPSTGTEGQPTVVLEALARGVGVVVRAGVYSDDYRDLPVVAYHDASDLGSALARSRGEPAALDVIARRFGVAQACDGLLAAGLASA